MPTCEVSTEADTLTMDDNVTYRYNRQLRVVTIISLEKTDEWIIKASVGDIICEKPNGSYEILSPENHSLLEKLIAHRKETERQIKYLNLLLERDNTHCPT